MLVLFLVFLATRVVYLSADPPKNLSWSLGLFFDEGIYNHNARNQILFGQWKLDEWNDFYYSAVSTAIKYGVLRIIGVGRAQIRLISVAYSMLSLLFVYWASKESYGYKTALIALFLFGTNYISTMYARIGMQDTQTLTIFILAFYVWQKGMPHLEHRGGGRGYVFLAGMVCFLSYTYKNLFLYLLPVPFAAFGLLILLQFQNTPRRTLLLKALGFFSGGTAAAFLLWFVTFYLPYREPISQFGNFFVKQQMFPRIGLDHFAENMLQTPFFKYFSNSPMIVLGSFLCLLGLYYLLCSERRIHIQPTDIFLMLWFWAAFAFSGIIAYRPTRYFLPIIPPMCMLAARFLGILADEKKAIKLPQKLHWPFYPLAVIWITILLNAVILPWLNRYRHLVPLLHLPTLRQPAGRIVNVGLAIILTGLIAYCTQRWHTTRLKVSKPIAFVAVGLGLAMSLYMNGKYYYQWVRSPEYVVPAVGQDLVARIGSNGYIGGMDAPGVAYDTPYKTLISWNQYVNYADNPITQYQLTHLFLSESRAVGERAYYSRTYPQEMQHATLLQQYSIKDSLFSLFSLVEPRLEGIKVGQTHFRPGQPLTTTMQVKNHDFRQAVRLNLNWFLYPQTLEHEARPISHGEAIHVWMPPEHSRTFTVTGNAPDHQGQYDLLLSLDRIADWRAEAEARRRHLGRVVPDIDAMGNRAVYHNVNQSPTAGFLMFGGYRDYQPGIYEAAFRLKIGDHHITAPVVRIDVMAEYGKTCLAQLDLRGTDFRDNRYTSVVLPYRLKDYTRRVEFRVYSYGTTDVWADAVSIIFREGVWYKDPIRVTRE